MISPVMTKVIVCSLVSLLALACASETKRPASSASNCANGAWGCNNAAGPNMGPYAQPQYPQPQPNYSSPPQTGYYPTTAAPGSNSTPYPPNTAPVPVTTAAPGTSLNPPPFSGYDPISIGDLQYLSNRSTGIVAELINNLDANTQGRVRNIPIIYDPNTAEVNAYASCAQSGKAAVTVTNGLELVVAHLAEAQAVDELYGTRRVDDYIALVAKNQQQGQVVVAPPAGFYTSVQLSDARKQSREQQVFDEEIGFVIGHELGHHYLNHLPCTSILPLNASEVGQVITSAVPMFNQPYESAADVAGITNVLRTGMQRNGYHFTEGGALLTMRFFAGLDQSSPVDIFAFERTHPPPSVRDPVIRSAAQVFRSTSAIRLPWGN
jgi:hypothetical protein